MNYSLLTKTTVSNKLKLDTEAIVHIFPDFDKNILDIIDKINLLRSNLQGVVIKNFRFSNKRINSQDYINTIKKSEENGNFRMFLSIPEIQNNRYIIVDHTLAVERLRDLSDRMSPNQLFHYLFDYIETEFTQIKSLSPTVTQIPLFVFNDANGLFNIIKTSSKYKISNDKLFDKFMIGCDAKTSTFITILGYEKKSPEFINPNISRLAGLLSTIDEIKPDSKEQKNDNNVEHEYKKDDSTNDLTKLSTSEYDNIMLSNILRKYNVRDPQIADIVREAVNDYKAKYKNYNKDDIEQVIFKAIYSSLYGKTEIPQEIKDDPKLLFVELSSKVNFSVPVYYPKLKEETVVRPKDVVKLKTVVGPARLENEFKENIHKNVNRLFKGLETRQHPVKIKKLDYEIKDNNLDRFIEYTITMQNITGGQKEPYDVKVRIPTLVNGRYFKFTGKEYILASQQFLIPITKNKPTQAR